MKGFNIKINYSIIIFVALFVQSFSNKKVENDRTKENLKANVKSYSEYYYEAVESLGNIEKGTGNLYEQVGYDEKGNRIESINYNSDGSLLSKETFKYDEKGNRIESIKYNSDLSLNSKATYKYDKKGNVIESNYRDSTSYESKETFKYEFDKQGNWVQKICFVNGIPNSILEREYEYYD